MGTHAFYGQVPLSDVAGLSDQLAGKATTGHTHTAAAVPVPPRTMSAAATASVDGAVAGDMQITCTGDTVITPTGTPDGRMLLVECLASGAQRVPSVATSVRLNGNVPSRSLTVPAGRVGIFGLRYSSLAGGWLLMAADIVGAVPDTTAPAVPTGLAATAGNGQVTLDWADNTEPDLAGYDYRVGTTNPPAGTPVRVTSSAVIVTGLANGTAQNFQVRAVDTSDNFSAWSAVVSATPTGPAATVPAAPAAPTGTAGDGQVVLAWAAPADGGASISDYVVQSSSNGGTIWTTFADGTSASTGATVTGLTNGTAYVFRVAAVNSVGQGLYSAASASITPAAPPAGTTIVDAFTGTAGATLSGRTAGWSTGATDFVISPSGTTAQRLATTSAALVTLVGPLVTSNHEVSVTMPTRGSSNNAGVVARSNLAGDTFYTLRTSSAGVLALQKSVAGSVTIVADTLGTFAPGDRLTIRCIGDQITALRNSVVLTTMTDTSPIVSGTYAGLRGGGNATQATYDDFSGADAT